MKLEAVKNERGVALLAVLTVVTLLTIIVIEFTYTVQLDQHRARNALNAMQASLLARSAINIEESFLLMDKDQEGKFDSYVEEWWLALEQFCQGVEIAPTVRIKCGLEDESGKLNLNMTRAKQPPNEVEGTVLTRDAFARDALRFILQEIDVEIVDELLEYWLSEPPPDVDGEPMARVPDFRSLEDFAARFRIPTRHLPDLRRKLTAVPQKYMSMVNANTAHPDVVRGLLGDEYGDVTGAFIERQRSEEPFKSKGKVKSWLSSEGGVSGEHLGSIARMFDVRSNMFRLRASALTNTDPSGEDRGGIGQTLSVLVWRRRGRCRAGEEPPCWTLKPLDWQKEGGARLFERSRGEDDELGLEEDFDEADFGW